MDRFEEIRERLDVEEKTLAQDVAEAEKRSKELHAELQRVRSAAKALKGASRTGRRASINAATNREATAWLKELLLARGPISLADLQEAIQERATEQGYSRSGLVLRLKQSLKSGPFMEENGLWKLTEAGHDPSVSGS